MKKITEEMHLEKNWYEEAKKQTLDSLPAFIEKLSSYQYDYDTVCHAIAAAAIGAAWAINSMPNGGITESQASCVMWEFIKEWMYSDNKTGLKILNYDDMLYPQDKEKFEKIISKETWKGLQKEAKEKFKNKFASPMVRQHWKDIIDGKIPFGYNIKK